MLIANELSFVSEKPLEFPLKCKAKVRYRQVEQPCLVTKNEDGSLEVVFDEYQRAITEKQSVVFYLLRGYSFEFEHVLNQDL